MGAFLSFRTFTLLLAIVFLLWCSTMEPCNARRGRHWRKSGGLGVSLSKKKGKNHGHNHHGNVGKGKKKNPSPQIPLPPPPPSPPILPPSPPLSTIFNVLDFGAKGDGTTDDTKAFQAAWASACKVAASSIIVPSDYTFLVGPVSFSGPYCQHGILFQLDGAIIAPTNTHPWGSGTLQWLEFTKLVGLKIQGSGLIDGRGSVWWQDSPLEDRIDSESKLIVPLNRTVGGNTLAPIKGSLGGKMPRIKPTALRFYGSFNVSVQWRTQTFLIRGAEITLNSFIPAEPAPFPVSAAFPPTSITIQNSPQCHLKFDNCMGVLVYNFSVNSPGDSPNTDGIHLQNSKDVLIHRTTLSCGDDCISIQTGCTNVYIHDVNCGPGHGISIGGLGKDNTKACVSNITVEDIIMSETMNGVRIKTWQGGSGLVRDVLFSNIQMAEVQLPIVIDQFYCDKSSCKNQSSAVALSGIHYEKIRGTYTVKPVHLACSDSMPCTEVTLTGIELKPIQERYHMYEPFCWQTFGELYSPTVPPIECLQIGKPSRNRIQADYDSC